jgi:hypothetical protein
MHRSGTSAVAGTAVRLGLAPPCTPLPAAADDNPGGFYESTPVVEANYHILLAAGCSWNLCLTFEPDRILETLQPGTPRVLALTLQREFGISPAFVLKDPRMCLTLPAWIPALHAFGTVPSVLIVVRHPAEVVWSLARRNQLPEVETAPHWLHHMLEAERSSRGLPRAVLFYNDLLRDWRRCFRHVGHTASITWPRRFEAASRGIDSFLTRPSHYSAAPAAIPGPPAVRQLIDATWATFRSLSDDPSAPAALACLDQVRAQFAHWRREAYPPGFKVVFPAT